MGFEVVYKYWDKLEDGSYNKDEVKEMKRKVGEPFEDVSLEALAQKIMAQMARRDIWVLPEVEIYELKKQKISFRETKGGVIIKNKKFFLDTENNSLVVQELPPEQPTSMLPVPTNNVQPHNNLPAVAPHNNLPLNYQQQQGPRRPLKFVVLDDGGVVQDGNGNRIPVAMLIKRSGLQFRPQQRYPVFQEMDDPRDKRVDKLGAPALDRKKVYVMWDDMKREVTVSQDYFVPADVRLEKSSPDDPWDSVNGGNGNKGPKLMFENEEEGAAMPELRGK